MKKYNLDNKSFEKYRAASKEQVNTLLSNVYAEGFEKGQKNIRAIKKEKPGPYLTEEEFNSLLDSTKGIGSVRKNEMVKKFAEINGNRRNTNATG